MLEIVTRSEEKISVGHLTSARASPSSLVAVCKRVEFT